jgi:RNA polymerase sigma-70 factor, ECF subfamily
MTALSLPQVLTRRSGTQKGRAAASREPVVSLANLDENELIAEAQQGSEEAFRILVERYQRRAYLVAYQLLHNAEEARDVAQEAFIRVFKSLHRFDSRYKFYTWLYKIVSNLSVDQLRKRGNRKRVSIDAIGDVSDNGAPVYQSLEHAELGERVRAVLDKLPPKYKTVMVLRELKGIDAKEIASIVGSTHATVRWRLHRARSLFRTEWVQLFGEDAALEALGQRVASIGRDNEQEGVA